MDNDVVISGISARLPLSSNLDDFKRNLFSGVHMVTEGARWIPSSLYGLPTRSGKLLDSDLASFDAAYFGVHARQAHAMDPTQRLLLEVAREAVFDSGRSSPSQLGSRVGVFVGTSTRSEAEEGLTSMDPDSITGYELIGCSRGMLANRVSYTFDWHGPSFTLDSGCSSSLLALERAVKALRSGECDTALVAGTNLTLRPESSLEKLRLGMLSPTGACRAFDASCDGYVRAEAIVAVLVERRSRAFVGTPYGSILAVKSNTDGFKSEGITWPSSESQARLTTDTYAEAGVHPNDFVYVEAHGTGTKVGDVQEVNAIASVFGERSSAQPLLIGSVKSNMGHAEGASGLCGLVKVCLAAQEGVLPANLHYIEPNPNIEALQDGRLKVVTENTPLCGTSLIGINSFGFGGVNVHAVFQPEPKPEPCTESVNEHEGSRLVFWAGRNANGVEYALRAMMRAQALLANQAFHTGHSPADFPVRGYKIMHAHAVDTEPLLMIKTCTGQPPKLWFVCSGMGTQWPDMARGLFQFPAAKASLEVCSVTLAEAASRVSGLPSPDFDLMEILLNTEPWIATGKDTKVVQMFSAIIAVQIAQVDLFQTIGLTADGVLGHSAGELVASYVAGYLTREQTILAAYARGLSITSTFTNRHRSGGMAVLGLKPEETHAVLKEINCSSDTFIACHNAPDNVTISGPESSVQAVLEYADCHGIFARELNSCRVAFHSPYVNSAADKYEALLQQILDCTPGIVNSPCVHVQWISSSVQHTHTCAPTFGNMAKYHAHNIRSPVLLQQAVAQIPEEAIVLEIGPKMILKPLLERQFPLHTKIIAVVDLKRDPGIALLRTLGDLYLAGFTPNLTKLFPETRPARRASISPLVAMCWNHEGAQRAWTVSKYSFNARWSTVHEVQTGDLAGHKIAGEILLPPSKLLTTVFESYRKQMLLDANNFYDATFSDVKFHHLPRTKTGQESVTLYVTLLKNRGEFEITTPGSGGSKPALIMSGHISVSACTDTLTSMAPYTNQKIDEDLTLSQSEVYKELRLRGYEYYASYRNLTSADLNPGTRFHKCTLDSNGDWSSRLEAAFQLTYLTQPRTLGVQIPVRLDHLRVRLVHKDFWQPSKGFLYTEDNSGSISGAGLELRGLKLKTIQSLNERGITRGELRSECYAFEPYFDTEPVERWPSKLALLTCIGIVLENFTKTSFKFCEVLDEESIKVLVKTVTHFVNSQPKCKLEWSQDLDCDLTIFHGTLPDSAQWKSSFVLLLIVQETQDQHQCKYKDESEYLLVARKMGSDRVYMLYKKCDPSHAPYKVIHVREDFHWLQDVKEALRGDQARTWLVANRQPSSGLLGFFNCLRKEPGGPLFRCLLLPGCNLEEMDPGLLKHVIDSDLAVAVVREDGVLGSYRHHALEQPAPLNKSMIPYQDSYYLKIGSLGDLSSLSWEPHPPYATEAQVRVHYATVNFRDIMLATGKLPTHTLAAEVAASDSVIGLEYAGNDDLHGRRVIGLVPCKGLSTHVTPDPVFTWSVPKSWTLAEAATVPDSYCTALYALLLRANLQRGESILIHSGTGSVGQAAIRIALFMQCVVYTTVSSVEKRDALQKLFPDLDPDHIAYSTTIAFMDDVQRWTQGRGVNIVLNSLSDEKLQASLRCLAPYGRFIETGKYDLAQNARLGMSTFFNNISFHGVQLDTLFEPELDPNSPATALKRRIAGLLQEGIDSGLVQPLSLQVYPANEVESAFRFMASAKHVGKVVIDMSAPLWVSFAPSKRTYFNPGKSYIIFGGLGGFGLQLTDWMIERGARNLILVSRSGVKTPYQRFYLASWGERAGVNVQVITKDLNSLQDVEKVLRGLHAAIGGVFNCAMVLRDGFMENLTLEDFRSACRPKADLTTWLDLATRQGARSLDHFVVFSSVSCGRGNAGQTSYGYANSVMERICERRRSEGLPGLAIQWGVIGDVGVLAEAERRSIQPIIGGTGVIEQSIASCLQQLDAYLQRPEPVLGSIVVNNALIAASSGPNILSSAADAGRVGGSNQALSDQILNVLGLKSVPNPSTSLGEIGVDSLMLFQIRHFCEQAGFNCTYEEIRKLNFQAVNRMTISK